MKKKIDIDQLQPGMYVASTNRSWLQLPFFRKRIRDQATIDKLRNYGVTQVVIDTRKGKDLDPGSESNDADPFTDPEVLKENLSRSASVHAEVSAKTAEMMEGVRNGEAITNEQADVQVNTLLDQIMDDPQSMLCMSVLKNTDEYTFSHCVNTSILALFVGRSLDLPHKELMLLGKGALLHDIGKCMIPHEILIKPGKLSDEEAEIIRTHVRRGVSYLHKMKDIPDAVVRFVAEHHERMDGTGYPDGLKGDQISWQGKLGAVLDVYDALIHENYYKESKDPTGVLEKMSGWVGTLYDQKAYEALADCIGIYPPGTLLMLDSGEIAITFQPNHQNPYRPKVLILTQADGIFNAQPIAADLTETLPGQHKYVRSILTTMSQEDANFNPFDILSNYSLQNTLS